MGRRTKNTRIRPTLLSRKHRKAPNPALSSKTSRTVINRHHTLQKKLAQAVASGDSVTAEGLEAEIDANGGLEWYQQASIAGQSEKRGGDSSKILMDWIKEAQPSKEMIDLPSLRLLEVGALSTTNACSKSPMFQVTGIDLHSQHPDIMSQDFMGLSIPIDDGEKFDIISLSLVLNYVPSPAQRGEMLRRTTLFLQHTKLEDPQFSALFPSLFLVLPAPCVTNSRYLDEKRLTNIMTSLGYSLYRQKLSSKLLYQLWILKNQGGILKFKKEVVRGGKRRNNFAIIVE
ncbi:putative methyltransferase-domain-containing protein [Terfezia claveryi]|nr:putative methyltransferase-domain-containing protein [Terfezia claveryi]